MRNWTAITIVALGLTALTAAPSDASAQRLRHPDIHGVYWNRIRFAIYPFEQEPDEAQTNWRRNLTSFS